MDAYSCADLVAFIRGHCPDVDEDSLDTIMKGKVSGKRALKYTTLEWTQLGIAYGDAVDIVGAINEFVEGNQENCYLSRTESNCTFKSATTSTTATPQGFAGQASDTMSCSQDSSGNDADPIATSKYECLRKFFTTKSFENMSDYEKDSYLAKKMNYERAVDCGLNVHKPSFMEDKPVPITKSVGASSSNDTVTVGPSSANLRRSSRHQTSSTPQERERVTLRPLPAIEVMQSSSCGQKQPLSGLGVLHSSSSPSSINVGPSLVRITDAAVEGTDPHEESDTSDSMTPAVQNSVTSPSTSRAFSDVEAVPSTSTALDTSSNSLPAAKTQKRRKKASDFLTEDQFFEKLPKYDVNSILLEAGRPLKAVRKSLEQNGIVTGAQRKLLMRTLTKHLYYDEHGKLKAVTTDMKNGMAASIVNTYPLFKDDAEGKRSWYRVFDPSGPSGFIANCSTNILRHLSPEERQRGGGQEHVELSSDEDSNLVVGTSSEVNYHDPDAGWMSLTMPFASQKGGLLKGMEKSFKVRRDWIMGKAPSITEILKKYPHLMSFGSEMMEKEFDTMYPDKGPSFLKEFPKLIPFAKRGKFVDHLEEFQPGETNDVIGTCFTLANQLPRPNLQRYNRSVRSKKKESVMPQLKTLVQTIPIGVNPKDVVQKNREEAMHPVQPYLMALVPEKQIVKIFLVADSELIQLKSASILQGLDLLFKSYSVFNVEYPLGWKVFWEMIEHGLFKIEPQKLTNSAHELLYQASSN